MGNGDVDLARFPIEVDLGDLPDTTPQIGLSTPLFPTTEYDIVNATIIPFTGTGGKSKGVVVVSGRRTVA